MVEEKQRIEAQREAARQRMVKEGVPELKTPGAAGYLGIKPIWLRTLTANGIITGYINDGYGWIEKTGPGYRGDEVFYYQSDLDAYRTSHPIRPETPIGEREEPSSLSETDRERIVEAAEKLYQETGGENGGYVTRTLVGKILREKKYKHRHDKIKYVCDQLGYPLPPNRSNWARRRESQINKRNPPRWREGEEA
ncbi:MAG: hypothetical protein J2P36_23165, partial [Ktedonobacteraceae bacterium]|nr:hypothetical protein [Ktedonobacteraceae bacterium]